MSRIAATFEALKRDRRKALIPYICAGDPIPEATVEVMHALAKAGADVIELGVPFSDPMADGPVIQRSSERALGKGVAAGWFMAARALGATARTMGMATDVGCILFCVGVYLAVVFKRMLNHPVIPVRSVLSLAVAV